MPAPEQLIVFAVLFVALALFVYSKWRYDVVALTALLIAALAGVVPSEQVFAGFGHPAVVTVVAVLVVSRALMNSGLGHITYKQVSRVGDNPVIQMAALTGLVAFCSAFMNNIGALALFLPVALHMARKGGRSPSLFLMPMAFGSLLGGLITLIGTPPNIIIAMFRTQTEAAAPFGMFDFAPVGAGVALAGVLFIALIGWRLIPRRGGRTPEESADDGKYIAEVKVPEGSVLVGRSPGDVEALAGADVLVVGYIGAGQSFSSPSSCPPISPGDTLIVRATAKNLKEFLDAAGLEQSGGEQGYPSLAGRGLQAGKPARVALAAGVFGAALLLATKGILAIQVSFMCAALTMVLSGLITLREAYESVDWPVIVLLGAMIPVGQALETTGGAQLIANALLALSGIVYPWVTLALLLAGTMVLSSIINNAATAVLVAPIAINMAEGMGVSADPFLMGVAIGASCAFLTPIGHQSNAVVMGPGGYKFGDYWRPGLPLGLLVIAVAVPLILYFWPLS